MLVPILALFLLNQYGKKNLIYTVLVPLLPALIHYLLSNILFLFYFRKKTLKLLQSINFPFSSLHRVAFCHFPFRWIYYCHGSKSTGKETGKTHLCALGGIASICFRINFHQTLRMHTQGCQGCRKTRNFVRNSKILIARSTIQPKLSKIKNH